MRSVMPSAGDRRSDSDGDAGHEDADALHLEARLRVPGPVLRLRAAGALVREPGQVRPRGMDFRVIFHQL